MNHGAAFQHRHPQLHRSPRIAVVHMPPRHAPSHERRDPSSVCAIAFLMLGTFLVMTTHTSRVRRCVLKALPFASPRLQLSGVVCAQDTC